MVEFVNPLELGWVFWSLILLISFSFISVFMIENRKKIHFNTTERRLGQVVALSDESVSDSTLEYLSYFFQVLIMAAWIATIVVYAL